MGRFLEFLTLFLSLSLSQGSKPALAKEAAEQVKYLKRQFFNAVRGPHQPAALIRSYANRDRAYTYDQALGALVFIHAGEQESARRILNALWDIQNRSGSWYFSYPIDDTREVSGAIAWVAIAVNAYHLAFLSSEFDEMARLALDHLNAQRVKVEFHGITSHPVRFSPQDIPSTSWDERKVISLEHNLDAYSAFRNYQGRNAAKYRAMGDDIRKFLESMWNGDHFHAGFSLETNLPNTAELYLDTQTWGVLALGRSGPDDQNYAAGLSVACNEFTTTYQKGQKKIFGFFDYRPTQGEPPERFIWTEGTLGATLALASGGPELSCEGQSAENILSSMRALALPSAGIPYATPNDRDFSTAASVAGTAWYYFAANRFNPFRPVPDQGEKTLASRTR